jgi:predicted transcriptional regulator
MGDRVALLLRIPKDLLHQLDEESRASGMSRSALAATALREYLQRRHLARVIAQGAGSISAEDAPWWSSPEEARAWLEEIRSAWRQSP